MNDLERRLIERIRESEEARRIAEEFLLSQKSPKDPPEPSAAPETSP